MFYSLNKRGRCQYNRTCCVGLHDVMGSRTGTLLRYVTTARLVAMATRNQYGGRHTASARLAVGLFVLHFLFTFCLYSPHSFSGWIWGTESGLRLIVELVYENVFDQERSVRGPVLFTGCKPLAVRVHCYCLHIPHSVFMCCPWLSQ